MNFEVMLILTVLKFYILPVLYYFCKVFDYGI